MREKTHFEQASQITATAQWGGGSFTQDRVLEVLMMETVLFTDHDILVFLITATAIALMFSVLGLATMHRMRSDMERTSDIEHHLRRLR